MASAISVAVVAILLGVPLWWKTTEVYRAPLPYDAIANLSHLLVSVQVYAFLLPNDNCLRLYIQCTHSIYMASGKVAKW